MPANRLVSTLMMSRTAAPLGLVTTPTLRGRKGSGCFRSSSKRPSFRSFSFSCSKASCRAPFPLGSSFSATSWYCPRFS